MYIMIRNQAKGPFCVLLQNLIVSCKTFRTSVQVRLFLKIVNLKTNFYKISDMFTSCRKPVEISAYIIKVNFSMFFFQTTLSKSQTIHVFFLFFHSFILYQHLFLEFEFGKQMFMKISA